MPLHDGPAATSRTPLVLPALLVAALPLAAQDASTDAVPASAFSDQLESLDDFVQHRLAQWGRGAENEEILATIRMQRDRGLIDDDAYREAVAALGGGSSLTRGGAPFSGTIVERDGSREIRADIADGRLERVRWLAAGGWPVREVRFGGDALEEIRYWPPPNEGARRSVTVYHDTYMGDATTRVTTPDGELVHTFRPEGVEHGEGWMAGGNMFEEDAPFYRAVEACERTGLFMDGTYWRVLGPRDGGCALRYGHWAAPASGNRDLIGTSMVCVHREGSGYDFVAALAAGEVPDESCRGPLAEALGGAGGDR